MNDEDKNLDNKSVLLTLIIRVLLFKQELDTYFFTDKLRCLKFQLNNISEIMNNLKTFNPNTQAVAFATKKKIKVTLEDIAERLDRIEHRRFCQWNRVQEHQFRQCKPDPEPKVDRPE